MNKNLRSLFFVVIAGEAIFMLPFLIPRLYRPLMLEAWNLTNTDIGSAFSAYGFSAMISYMLGGPFADKYSPRVLISSSLIITGLLGFALILFPSRITLITLYFFFGISTILLMWGALIKVTHLSGGEDKRSSAMGILDGGRGLFAALMSTLLVFLISIYYPESELQTRKKDALALIYTTVILFTFIAAIGVWFFLKNTQSQTPSNKKWDKDKALTILKDIRIWLLGIIVLSSYCGYKSVDNYSVYLVDVTGKSIKDSSFLTSIIFWLRPISALVCGILVDKIHTKIKGGRFLALFILLGLAFIFQVLLILNISIEFHFIFGVILFSATFAYALRAVYFSIFGDLNISDSLVGTTVGIVSFVGYLPDMFFGLLTGHLIDASPGEEGYIHTFIFTGSFLLLGALASFILYQKSKSLTVS